MVGKRSDLLAPGPCTCQCMDSTFPPPDFLRHHLFDNNDKQSLYTAKSCIRGTDVAHAVPLPLALAGVSPRPEEEHRFRIPGADIDLVPRLLVNPSGR